jgi:hypothetical protein
LRDRTASASINPSSGSYCIFQEPWWLDAVAAGAWQSLEVTRGTRVVARMPIVPRRICGLTIIRQPPLTPTLGPWIELPSTTMARRLTEEKKLFNDLIDKLPSGIISNSTSITGLPIGFPFTGGGSSKPRDTPTFSVIFLI